MTYEPVSNIYDEGSISIKQAASLSISDDYAYVQLVCVCVCVCSPLEPLTEAHSHSNDQLIIERVTNLGERESERANYHHHHI